MLLLCLKLWVIISTHLIFTFDIFKLYYFFYYPGNEEDERRISYIKKREMCKDARGKPMKKSRDWILAKKERRRRQGLETRPDTKFTGRKRSGRF